MGEPIATVGDLAGICGHDGTSWEKVLIDASKRLVVAIAAFSAALEVTQDTPGDLLVGTHHYDGSAWRKANLLWGYHDILGEQELDDNLDVGTNYLYGTAVPSGELWVITAMGVHYSGTAPSRLEGRVLVNSVHVPIVVDNSPTSGVWIMVTGQWILAEGDQAIAVCVGATAGDTMYLRYAGYKMDITM